MRKLDDPIEILRHIAGEKDLDVLQAAIARLAEPPAAGTLTREETSEAVESARSALKALAAEEIELTGKERLITGSIPNAVKIVTQFERVVAEIAAQDTP